MEPHQRHLNPANELADGSGRRSQLLEAERSEDDLHVCPECQSNLVHPTQWMPVDLSSWQVELRCPDCELRVIDVYPQSVLDRFDVLLDAATRSLLDDLSQLERIHMEEELERFVTNLADDRLLPEDF